MISVIINNIDFRVSSNISVLEACSITGSHIPRFCYHESLSVAGNCRMCLVEIDPFEKPIASCAMDIEEGMNILIDSPFVLKARESILEMILINHPLDCPICDQAGECDLQDQTKTFGLNNSRYFYNKNSAVDYNKGPFISTIMTRCISCTRCVRYGNEIAGISFFGTINRGNDMKISSYINQLIQSEISGNVVDLCPVGALTSLPYKFKARPWELISIESVDTTDAIGSNIYVQWKENEIVRILPRNNPNINDNFISDKARYIYDSNNIGRLLNYHATPKKLAVDDCINIIITNDIGIESLLSIKEIQRSFTDIKVKILLDYPIEIRSNLFDCSVNNFKNLQSLKNVSTILLSCNSKNIAPILNYKLRLSNRLNDMLIYNFGIKQNNNTITKQTFICNKNIVKSLFTNINFDSTLSVLFNKILLIVGKEFSLKISNLSLFGRIIKNFNKKVNVLEVKDFSNEYGANLLNVSNVINSFASYSSLNLYLNISSTTQNNIYIKEINREKNLVLSSHAENIIPSNYKVVPVATSFEENDFIVNTFGNKQKVSSPININLSKITLKHFIKNSLNYDNSNFFNIYEKVIASNEAFIEYSSIDKNNAMYEGSVKVFFNNLKQNVKDPFKSNKLTRMSKLLTNGSNNIRTNFRNF